MIIVSWLYGMRCQTISSHNLIGHSYIPKATTDVEQTVQKHLTKTMLGLHVRSTRLQGRKLRPKYGGSLSHPLIFLKFLVLSFMRGFICHIFNDRKAWGWRWGSMVRGTSVPCYSHKTWLHPSIRHRQSTPPFWELMRVTAGHFVQELKPPRRPDERSAASLSFCIHSRLFLSSLLSPFLPHNLFLFLLLSSQSGSPKANYGTRGLAVR